jgi:HD-like signal output (HDOD) protein
VLSAWHFPEHVCSLIGRHHDPVLPHTDPLDRALGVARILADALISAVPPTIGDLAHLAWLTEGRLTDGDLPGVMERMADRSAALLDGLAPRR